MLPHTDLLWGLQLWRGWEGREGGREEGESDGGRAGGGGGVTLTRRSAASHLYAQAAGLALLVDGALPPGPAEHVGAHFALAVGLLEERERDISAGAFFFFFKQANCTHGGAVDPFIASVRSSAGGGSSLPLLTGAVEHHKRKDRHGTGDTCCSEEPTTHCVKYDFMIRPLIFSKVTKKADFFLEVCLPQQIDSFGYI